jgi:hypothetical protein
LTKKSSNALFRFIGGPISAEQIARLSTPSIGEAGFRKGSGTMSFDRFNSQFEETEEERSERLRTARHQRTLDNLRELIIDLASSLTDEGPDWSTSRCGGGHGSLPRR